MERIMSTEDKIRRAEEIYHRRRENQFRGNTARVNINEKKDIKLFKKVFIQILVSLAIYSGFYIIKKNNYIFSEDFINKSKEILTYDLNFQEIYEKTIEMLQKQKETTDEENTDDNTEDNAHNNEEENAIGGAEEDTKEETQNSNELSQMEQDALEIKKSINFIKPIDGTITSEFGWRNPSTSTVPKYHTGLDIANKSGTKIYSSTEGDVILASNVGDYRKPS